MSDADAIDADAIDAYVTALLAGEAGDPDEWLARHPDLDEGLREDLALVASLHRAAESVAQDSLSTDAEEPPAPRHRLLAPGARLGEHVVEELVGTGGMGEVYRARHEVLDKPVAIKLLRPLLADDPDAAKRFRAEVKAQAKLAPHPNVVTATHASEHEGRLYLVMELVPGTNLARLVRAEGPLPPARAAALIRQAAAGLAHAHAAGIVHRDVKPSNLLLTEDGETVKVVDLGLATVSAPVEGEGRRTWVDELVGSLDYMAPEQANHPEDADARSDLYALGCTLYTLLEGRAPFADRLALKKLMAHAVEPPPPLSRPVPAPLRRILERLLQKDPAARFQSAEALVDALDEMADTPAALDAPTPAPTTAASTAPARPARSSRASVWVVVGMTGVLLFAIGVGWFIRVARQPSLSEHHPVAGALGPEDGTRPKERSRFDAHVVSVEPGTTYLFTMRSQALDPMLVLRADGWEIDQCDDAPGHGLAAQIVWRADRDAVELVATTPEEGAEGPYVLTVERVTAPRVELDAPVEGSLVEGDARYGDDSWLDRYWLRVDAGETYVLEMRGEGFAPFLFLETDDRRMIAFAHADGDDPRTARVVYVAEQTGAVFVGANAERPGEGGPYRLSVASELSGEEVLRQTGVLGEGDPVLGDDSYYDSHALEVRAGRTYVITMRSEDFDTYLLLVDPNDVRVQQNDDAIGTDSRIVHRATETRRMRIFANSYTSGMRGQYTLSVRELPE